jgi:leucyl aminopeptidase
MPVFQSQIATADESVGADLLVVPLRSTEGLYALLAGLGPGIATAAARAVDLGDFRGEGDRLLVHARGPERYPRALLVGIGPEDSPPGRVRNAFTAALRDPMFSRMDTVAVLCGPALGSGSTLTSAVAEAVDGISQGVYRYTLSTESRPKTPGRFLFLAANARAVPRIDEGIRVGGILGRAVCLAKDLANTPANEMSPHDLAERTREFAKGSKLTVKVLEGAALEREGLEAIRVVGAGSSRAPRLIVLEYRPAKMTGPPIALVGKGLVYDTGGLSIKPMASMVEMKFDKCGGCVVLGAMQAIAALELPVPVVAVVPAVENSISGDSYRPGDVIGSRSGKKIEVLNTDAEGRLVLADALDYVITKYSPRLVVDAATLTGAVFYALGDHACAVLGTDDDLVADLEDAGEATGERAWSLPLWSEYRDDVSSTIADVRNTGTQGAGTIAGAAFLQRFVRDVPWAHLDIAGVSRDRRDSRVGATGFGVRLLVEAVRGWAPKRAARNAS